MVIKSIKIGIQEKASLAYIIANILSKGLNFITIPVFTRLLSTSEMGVTSTFSSWQTILYAVVSLGLVSGSFNIAMVTYEKLRDRYMAVCLAVSSVSAGLFLLFCVLISPIWEELTDLPYVTIWVMAAYMFLQPAMDYWYAKERYENKYKAVFWVSTTSALLSVLISVFGVWAAARGNVTYNLGSVKIVTQFAVLFIYSFIIYIIIFAKGKCVYDKEMIIFALKLSLPLVIHSLAKNVLDISDRIMISRICGQSDAGIYGTIFTISLMALVIWGAINSALVPEMFESLKISDFAWVEKKIYGLITVFGEISIIAVLFSPEIIHILTTRSYYDAVYLMPPLFASVFLSSIYNIYGNFLLYKKHTVLIMVATLLAAGFNVITNYFFIKKYGYTAASYTTLASTLFLAIGQGIMQAKVYKEKVISHARIALIGMIGAVGCLLSALLFENRLLRYLTVVLITTKLLFDAKKVLKTGNK